MCLLSILVLLTTTRAPLAALPEVLHEPLPPDPQEDMAMGVRSAGGGMAAAIHTPRGVVSAPDPTRPPSADDTPDSLPTPRLELAPDAKFAPDNDTHRPDVLPYEDPFTPSTAPFKRLAAFDGVDAQFNLVVSVTRQAPWSTHAVAAPDGSEDLFYADLVVDVKPGEGVRVPSVGPGAKVLHARLGVGPTELPIMLTRDGADNWFVASDRSARARLVLEMSIPRATFGGDFGDPGWSDLPLPSKLPPNVAADANRVALAIGVSRAQTPREDVKRLVAYFRGFSSSEERPTGHADVFLDLAMSKKGVCRHRAYAFLITALGLGLPARMVMNEAHAWVEVNDGTLWKRIDLGGAGRTLDSEAVADNIPHEPPPDPFAWPSDAERGSDMASRARAKGGADPAARAASGTGSATGNGAAQDQAPVRVPLVTDAERRGPSAVTISGSDGATRRGSALHLNGAVKTGNLACANVVIDFFLRDVHGGKERFVGSLATDEVGAFIGALVIPETMPLGDYDVLARTPGDARCSAGESH